MMFRLIQSLFFVFCMICVSYSAYAWEELPFANDEKTSNDNNNQSQKNQKSNSAGNRNRSDYGSFENNYENNTEELPDPLQTMKQYNRPMTAKIQQLKERKKKALEELTTVNALLLDLSNKLTTNQAKFDAAMKANKEKTENLQKQSQELQKSLTNMIDQDNKLTNKALNEEKKTDQAVAKAVETANKNEQKKEVAIATAADKNAAKVNSTPTSSQSNYNATVNGTPKASTKTGWFGSKK